VQDPKNQQLQDKQEVPKKHNLKGANMSIIRR